MTYSCVKIQNVDALGPQLLQAGVHRLQHLVVGVGARLGGIGDLGGQRQAAVLPAGVAREGLLLAADVHAGRVDLAVPARLEPVEHAAELAGVGDAGAGRLVGAKRHQAEDDARRGGLGDEGGHGGGG